MQREFLIPSRVWGFETIGMRENCVDGGREGGGVNYARDGVITTLSLVLSWMNNSLSLL